MRRAIKASKTGNIICIYDNNNAIVMSKKSSSCRNTVNVHVKFVTGLVAWLRLYRGVGWGKGADCRKVVVRV